MPKNLVIVESPAKAKTIEKYLGKDYQVASSYGHIRDLVKKGMGIDIKNNFEPEYAVSPEKKEVVSKLKALTKKSDTVWLASDEDREGEAIAWHLAETLGLNPATTNRIVFHEITKKAIDRAIQNPRKIDQHLVDAQQARRILDRLVGFELSPVLWKKVQAGLSAGRVQSVAVRLIVERERDIQAFEPKSSFRVVGIFQNGEGKSIKAVLNKNFQTEKEAKDFLEKAKNHSFKITEVEKKPAKKSPAPPFTTSTLQQEASRKLYFSVSQTMTVAQRLYEAGYITYMRTDSVNLSEEARSGAASEIKKSYGDKFHKTRTYKTKSSGAQEAHEAIRPTDFSSTGKGADAGQKKLYDLIWKRAIASQMSDAELERTVVRIDTPDGQLEFVARGEVIKFEGFLKVYLEGTDDEDAEEQEGMLPAVKKGEALERENITATQRFTRPPARFTEASLVKKLEELGIGRPSTYAPTISTIQKRNYVEKSDLEGTERKYQELRLNGELKVKTLTETTGADKGKMIPTDIGLVVNDFLVEHFKQILDYHFTAKVEEQFDEIARGQEKWEEMIDEFYSDFHPHLKDVEENSERASGERALGDDPKTGKPIIARIGRYGPMVQIGSTEDEEKPKFASLRKTQSIETVTLEEALKLFELPRTLGDYEGKTVVTNFGRFGPYVRHDGKFASLKPKEGDDPYEIELDRAIELIEQKREADRNKFIQTFDDKEPIIEVLNGRWGPYLKMEKKNYKIPKDVDPKKLTRAEAEELIKNPPKPKRKPAKKKKGVGKKTTAKKTSSKK